MSTRREFIALLGGAGAAWPIAARAQQGGAMRRIGVLMGYAETDSDAQAWYAAFREALQNRSASSPFRMTASPARNLR